MTGVNIRFTDEDSQRITERIRTLARFEKGDRVTVEPSDTGISYASEEYEGMPLTVRDVCWRGNDLTAAPSDDDERFRPADPNDRYSEEHYVTLTGEYEHFIHDEVLITSWSYKFRGEDTRPVSESALIPWAEYREDHERVHLKPHRDGRYEYVVPKGEDAESCPVCGCDMRNVSGHDQKVVHVGSEDCAACGYNFGFWD